MAMIPIIGSITAYAQTNTTPAVTVTATNLPNNIEFIPQKAFIYTVPPVGQENTNNGNVNGNGNDNDTGGITGAIIGAVSLAGVIYTKFTGDKKAQMHAIENSKRAEVQYSLAKQLYEANPEYAQKIDGNAPETKLAKLQENKEQAAKIAAKS